MIELICGDGLAWLQNYTEGFVVTDSSKSNIRELLALSEKLGFPMINAYARAWLKAGKFSGEKRVQPYRAIIRAFPEEKTIIDPFMGSGNIGIAAVLEDRDFIGIEINTERFNHARIRIENTAAGAVTGNF